MKKKQKTLFYQIRSNQEKKDRLCALAKSHFLEKTPLLILAQTAGAGNFIDDLLWAYPVHTLLPHEFSLTISKEIICISTPFQNPNSAHCILNLTNEALIDQALLLPSSFDPLKEWTIYEFEELSTPTISKEKYHSYKDANFALASF